MLASSATAAVCAGPDNLIVSWNTAAEQLLGYAAHEAIGKPLSIIIPARYRAAHDHGLARAVEAGEAKLAGQAVDIVAVHADGREIPVDICLSMWFEAGQPMFGALLRDITDRQSAQDKLKQLAHRDTLTNLPNRNALQKRMHQEVAKAPCALLLLDLDGFKHVNDTLGHSVGDQLLSAVAGRLSEAIGDQGMVARLGGDEFAILVPGNDLLALDTLSARVIERLRSQFEVAKQSIYIGTSIGIALSPHDAMSVEHLLSKADLALYSAKSAGGGVRTFFTPALQSGSERRHRLNNELRQALQDGEFELWFQPQVSLLDGTLLGVEALLRWRHPEHGVLPPGAFIEVLEESAFAEEVGDWIIKEACATGAQWRRSSGRLVRVGVNLFAAQLRSGRLLDVVCSALAEHQMSPGQLEIEITETTVLRHTKSSTSALSKLREMGVAIAFDDFGTGYASLSLLQTYPLTRLKIDRSFVSHIHEKPGDAAIVRAVVAMAASLGLTVIAEGVESQDQADVLVRLGCNEAQGYLYGTPMCAAAINDRFLKRTLGDTTALVA